MEVIANTLLEGVSLERIVVLPGVKTFTLIMNDGEFG